MDFIKKYKSSENISCITTFVIGFATHFFGFINVIHNYDDISVLPAVSNAGVTSGRWFLTIIHALFAKIGIAYNLPYVNSILFILLISISVKYIICILEIKNPVSAILIGAIFVTFPSVTGIMFFKYTVVSYGIAILCSVLSVWYMKRFKFGFILSIFLIACSLGIYQAYVPITISLMIILLLRNSLTKNFGTKDILWEGIKYVGTLILGIIAYYILLKICLIKYNTQLLTYQGIDKMGVVEITQLPGLIKRTFYEFFSIAFNDYNGVSQTSIIQLGILLLGCICAGLIIFTLGIHKKNWISVILTALLCAVLPLAINFIVIMCPTSIMQTRMVYSFALIFTVPFVLLEIIEPLQFSAKFFTACKKHIKKAVSFITLIIILSYAYLANLNYTQLYYTTQKVENYMSSLVLQVRMTEGFDSSMEWAFIGDIVQDPLLYDNWEQVPRYSGNASIFSLINTYSRLSWVKNCFGYNIPLVDENQLAELGKDARVIDMPCFPDDGSIQVLDDVVIIKLENIEIEE